MRRTSHNLGVVPTVVGVKWVVSWVETQDPPEDPLYQILLSSQNTTLQQAQISLHALLGHSIPQTLRVLGHLPKNLVAVLVDSGSTNNFIQDKIAKQLGLTLKPAQSFQVLVGNGEELQCSTICSNVGLQLGPYQFRVYLFVVPLRGAEIVLGVE